MFDEEFAKRGLVTGVDRGHRAFKQAVEIGGLRHS
jgi:hypothetical protein